ncbi:MAG: cyclic lactone autoinducer peptide [Clostridiales bacterium]|nr:cyclic lactone autoinducer peptide [Clostridiales bacterium]
MEKGGFTLLKLLAKIAEKYAKSTNSACMVWYVLHQPKMPATLIKKD